MEQEQGSLPKPRYSFLIAFGTSVDKYQSLINSSMDEIKKLKANGPSQVDLDKFKIEEKRQLELDLKENGFWASEILGSVQNETDPTKVTRYLEELDKVTVESVKAAANKYLKEENFYKFILLPDSTK